MTSIPVHHRPVAIRSKGGSPPPTFGNVRTHDAWKQESCNRALFLRLDSSEYPPSNHSSVLDAAPCTSDDYDELSALNRDIWEGFDGAENTNPYVRSDNDSAIELKIDSYESPLRRHGEPLETIMEQRSHTTLTLDQQFPNLGELQTLRHRFSSPCRITDNPLPNRRRLSRSLDEAGLRKQRRLTDLGLFSEDSDVYGGTQYASPAQPPLPAIPRTSTPPGCPRWPGDLPATTVPANCPGERRTTSDHIRNVIRKLVASPQNDHQRVTGIRVRPAGHQAPNAQGVRPVWRPPVSGQFGRRLETVQSHPFHRLGGDDEEKKEQENASTQHDPATTAMVTQHNASTRDWSTVHADGARPSRAVSHRISSLFSLPSRIFDTQKPAGAPSSTTLLPSDMPTATAGASHSSYIVGPHPVPIAPPPASLQLDVVRSSLEPAAIDGSLEASAPSSIPVTSVLSSPTVRHASSASTLDRTRATNHQGYRLTYTTLSERRGILLECEQCQSSVHVHYYNSALDHSRSSTPSTLRSIHDLAESSPNRALATASPTRSIVAEEDLGRQSPFGKRLRALHGSLRGLSPLRSVHTPTSTIHAPSPLRPRSPPGRTYELFPRPDPNIAPRPPRSLSSMLRFRNGDLQQRESNLERQHCVHGKPLESPPSAIRFTGVKIQKRRWWRAGDTSRDDMPRARCWRCDLKMCTSWLMLDCCASPGRSALPADHMTWAGFKNDLGEVVHGIGSWMPGHCFGQVVDDGASGVVPAARARVDGRRMLVD